MIIKYVEMNIKLKKWMIEGLLRKVKKDMEEEEKIEGWKRWKELWKVEFKIEGKGIE